MGPEHTRTHWEAARTRRFTPALLKQGKMRCQTLTVLADALAVAPLLNLPNPPFGSISPRATQLLFCLACCGDLPLLHSACPDLLHTPSQCERAKRHISYRSPFTFPLTEHLSVGLQICSRSCKLCQIITLIIDFKNKNNFITNHCPHVALKRARLYLFFSPVFLQSFESNW